MRRCGSGSTSAPTLDDDRTVTPELFRALLDDEMANLRSVLGPEVYDSGRFPEAIKLFSDMTLADSFEEFLTLPAYRLIA